MDSIALLIHFMSEALAQLSLQQSLPEACVGGHGYSSPLVCLSVCDMWVYLPGCQSTAYTAWIASTQQVISFILVADFDIKALLSNKSEQKLRNLNLHVAATELANSMQPLFEVPTYLHGHVTLLWDSRILYCDPRLGPSPCTVHACLMYH